MKLLVKEFARHTVKQLAPVHNAKFANSTRKEHLIRKHKLSLSLVPLFCVSGYELLLNLLKLVLQPRFKKAVLLVDGECFILSAKLALEIVIDGGGNRLPKMAVSI